MAVCHFVTNGPMPKRRAFHPLSVAKLEGSDQLVITGGALPICGGWLPTDEAFFWSLMVNHFEVVEGIDVVGENRWQIVGTQHFLRLSAAHPELGMHSSN